MKKKTTWQVRAIASLGAGTTTVENGYTIYKPRNGWITLKEFGSMAEADNWLCEYIRKNRYPNDDFTIRKVETE